MDPEQSVTLVRPKVPGGFMELLPQEQRQFDRLKHLIQAGYARYGFIPIETNAIELQEVLKAKGGGETEQQLFEIVRPPKFALRFDLTVPLARYVALHRNQLPIPFRRQQIQRVWRGEAPQRGRFNEFYQCDFDIVGARGPAYDAEVPAVINDVLQSLQIGEFTIRINNRKLLNGLFEELDFTGDQVIWALQLVDKLERDGQEKVVAGLERLELNSKQVSRLMEFIQLTGSTNQLLEQLANQAHTAVYQSGLQELATVVELTQAAGVPTHRYAIDLRVARGLQYYTSTVYETTLNDYPSVGSICSGGRFDNLAQYYTREELPGVGASIGLTRLYYVLKELGRLPAVDAGYADAMVAIVDASCIAYAMSVAGNLRARGLSVQTSLDPSVGLGKQLSHADRQGITYVVIVGEYEQASQTVTVKNLCSKDQLNQATIDLAYDFIV